MVVLEAKSEKRSWQRDAPRIEHSVSQCLMDVLKLGQKKAFIPNHLTKGEDGTCVQPRVAVGHIRKGSIDHVGTSMSLNRFNSRVVLDQNENISKDLMWSGRGLIGHKPGAVRVICGTTVTMHVENRL